MKKSNYLVLIASAIVAAVLLFMWFSLGFSKVDNPIDITLAVVWWVIIVAIVAIIIRAENSRKRRIRTVYVSPSALFNSEKGIVALDAGTETVQAIEAILQGLKYGFSREDMPKQEDFDYRFVVETDTYKPAKTDSDEPTWKGKVTKIDRQNGNVETAFASQQEFQEALEA